MPLSGRITTADENLSIEMFIQTQWDMWIHLLPKIIFLFSSYDFLLLGFCRGGKVRGEVISVARVVEVRLTFYLNDFLSINQSITSTHC